MCGVVGYEPMAGDVAAHGGVGDSPHRGQPAAEQGGQRACEGPEARQPSTMHAVAALASGLCRHTSTKCERQRLGQSLHDTFGTTDALYGTLADTIPTLTTAGSVPCSLAVWLRLMHVPCPPCAFRSPLRAKRRERLSLPWWPTVFLVSRPRHTVPYPGVAVGRRQRHARHNRRRSAGVCD
jgi:hypothetical protein